MPYRDHEKLCAYMREYQREYRQRPEVKERMREYQREYQREYYQRPEVKERMREYKRKRREALKAAKKEEQQ